MIIRMKASVAFNVYYRFSNNGGANGSMCYDESVGLAVTTEYQDFEISIASSEYLTNFGVCVQLNTVYIESITFA